jgi:hypothetical protein
MNEKASVAKWLVLAVVSVVLAAVVAGFLTIEIVTGYFPFGLPDPGQAVARGLNLSTGGHYGWVGVVMVEGVIYFAAAAISGGIGSIVASRCLWGPARVAAIIGMTLSGIVIIPTSIPVVFAVGTIVIYLLSIIGLAK